MAFNNYLGKIVFLCLSQCKMCLHCVVLLWSHWYWRPSICASHAGFHWSQASRAFAKATRAVGEKVKFPVPSREWREQAAKIMFCLKTVSFRLRSSQRRKTENITGQEEQPKNNTVRLSERCASTENQVPEASKRPQAPVQRGPSPQELLNVTQGCTMRELRSKYKTLTILCVAMALDHWIFLKLFSILLLILSLSHVSRNHETQLLTKTCWSYHIFLDVFVD